MKPPPIEPAPLPSVLRFSVAAPDGRRSMPWRVWTGDRRPSDEVYVAPRHMAGDLKFSAHISGYAQHGPTKRLRDKLSPDDREALWRTRLDTEGLRVVLRLLFHNSELRPRSADTTEAAIGIRDDEDALLLLLAIGPLSGALPPGWRLVGAVARTSEEPVLLIAGSAPAAPQMLAEALEALRAPHQTWQLDVDWQYKAHAVVVLDGDEDGPPLWAEFAVDEEPAPRLPSSLAWFPGQVLTLADLPVPMPEDVEACAAVWIGDAGKTRLYVNEYARCDHEHLAFDVSHLLRAFADSGPDLGWTHLRGPDGGWITAIVTEAAADRFQATPRNHDVKFAPPAREG